VSMRLQVAETMAGPVRPGREEPEAFPSRVRAAGLVAGPALFLLMRILPAPGALPPEDHPAAATSGAVLLVADSPLLDAPRAEYASTLRGADENRGPRGRTGPGPCSLHGARRPWPTAPERAKDHAFRAACRLHLGFAARLALARAGLLSWHATAPPAGLS